MMACGFTLPQVRGRFSRDVDLAAITWFRVGGKADVLFRPADLADLQAFLSEKPADLPVTVLGVGSNLLVRDGGIDGIVLRLGGAFAQIECEASQVTAGAGALDLNVALSAQEAGIGGLEFLSGIPGTIGGALRMNAGAYGSDIGAVLYWAELLDPKGKLHRLSAEDLHYSYRHCDVPEDWIFVRAQFNGSIDDPQAIAGRIAEIQHQRAQTQPVRARTGGSTFTNPPGARAWELIDRAGCRGLRIGGAEVSDKHCNFLINTGSATAADLEALGEEVRKRVKTKTGIDLQWEIKRIGRKGYSE